MTQRKTTRPRKKTAAQTAMATEWIDTWLDPKTYEDFHVTAHASDLQNSSLDHLEAMTMSTIAFVGDRLKKDFTTMRDLAECRDAAAFVRIQNDFWQTAWTDYRDQMMRMGEEVRGLADDTEEVICESSDDATKALRAKASARS